MHCDDNVSPVFYTRAPFALFRPRVGLGESQIYHLALSGKRGEGESVASPLLSHLTKAADEDNTRSASLARCLPPRLTLICLVLCPVKSWLNMAALTLFTFLALCCACYHMPYVNLCVTEFMCDCEYSTGLLCTCLSMLEPCFLTHPVVCQ